MWPKEPTLFAAVVTRDTFILLYNINVQLCSSLFKCLPNRLKGSTKLENDGSSSGVIEADFFDLG